MTYIFYDTETTGLKNEFDQILQLGAIKTDEELNEIDRIVLRCRLLPHVVPSPRALQVSRTTHSMLIDPGLPWNRLRRDGFGGFFGITWECFPG